MSTYYEKNEERLFEKAKQYYEHDKEILKEQAKPRYRELSNEQKNIKQEYGRIKYQNMSEED